MTNPTPEEIVAELRSARDRGVRPSAPGVDLGYADLGYADLRGADLRGANLRYADLGYADLRGADLRGANLRYADLGGADLRGADLRGVDLRYANLRGANLWGGFCLEGLPSGQVTMVPTCDGWQLRVGCWKGTVSELEVLIASDDGWPQARGAEEVARRRPSLQALIVMLNAHMVLRADKLTAVAHWKDKADD